MKQIRSLLLLLTLMIAATGCINDDEPAKDPVIGPPGNITTGSQLPDFTVTLLDGSTVSTRDLAGAPSVIMFFDVTCPDCQRTLPEVQRLHQTLPELRIICIGREQTEESVREYWTQHSLTLPVSPQEGRDVFELFASWGVPRIYVSNAELTVVADFSDYPLPSFEDLILAVSKAVN